MSTLAGPAAFAGPMTAIMDTDCTTYEQTGVSLCGEMRTKYIEMGGPDGPLGAPTSGEEDNADGVGRHTTFQNDAVIYLRAGTGAHVVSGPILQTWMAAGAENSDVGYPISDEIDNTGTYARFGDRRIDFENGVVYRAGNQAVMGAWSNTTPSALRRSDNVASSTVEDRSYTVVPTSYVATFTTRRFTALLPTQVQPETCPAGTTNYPGPAAIYNCLVVDMGTDGYPNGIREGRPDPVPGNVAPDGLPSIEGFGRAHADVDHDVGFRALRLMVRNVPPFFQTSQPALNRFRHVNVFRVGDTPVEGLAVVVQRLPDTENLVPDDDDFGLITGYCSDGTDPNVPGTPHPGGRCPLDLPAPFGKQTGGS